MASKHSSLNSWLQSMSGHWVWSPRNDPPRSEQSASSTSWQVASLRQHTPNSGQPGNVQELPAPCHCPPMPSHTDSATKVHDPLGWQHEPRDSHTSPHELSTPSKSRMPKGLPHPESTTKRSVVLITLSLFTSEGRQEPDVTSSKKFHTSRVALMSRLPDWPGQSCPPPITK